MKFHVNVSPVLSGQFTGVIRAQDRSIIAMTLPTYDRNEAARAGSLVRAQLG